MKRPVLLLALAAALLSFPYLSDAVIGLIPGAESSKQWINLFWGAGFVILLTVYVRMVNSSYRADIGERPKEAPDDKIDGILRVAAHIPEQRGETEDKIRNIGEYSLELGPHIKAALLETIEKGDAERALPLVFALGRCAAAYQSYAATFGDTQWLHYAYDAEKTVAEATNPRNNGPMFQKVLGNDGLVDLAQLHVSACIMTAQLVVKIGGRTQGELGLKRLHHARDWCEMAVYGVDHIREAGVDCTNYERDILSTISMADHAILIREHPDKQPAELKKILSFLQDSRKETKELSPEWIFDQIDDEILEEAGESHSNLSVQFVSFMKFMHDFSKTEPRDINGLDHRLIELDGAIKTDAERTDLASQRVMVANAYFLAFCVPILPREMMLRYADRAAELYTQGLEVRTKQFSPWQYAHNNIHLGFSYAYPMLQTDGPLDESNVQAAKDAFQNALSIYDERSNATENIAARKTLAQLALRQGKYKDAIEICSALISSFPTMLLSAATVEFRRSLVKLLAGVGEIKSIAHIRLNEPTEAILSSELGKSLIWKELVFFEENISQEAQSRYRGLLKELDAKRTNYSQMLAPGGMSHMKTGLERTREREAALDEIINLQNEIRKIADDSGNIDQWHDYEKRLRSFLTSDKEKRLVFFFNHSHDAGFITLAQQKGAQQKIEWKILDRQKTKNFRRILKAGDEKNWVANFVKFRSALAGEDETVASRGVYDWNRYLETALPDLWDEIVEPAVECLLGSGVDEDDLVYMIPAGSMSVLPLHTSGKKIDSGWRCLIDILTPTFLPSLMHVLEEKPPLDRNAGEYLGITDLGDELEPATQSANPIDVARGAQVASLEKTVTIEALKSALSKCSYACLLCHGSWSQTDPDKSALHLSHGDLNLNDIRSIDFECGPFIAIGACESAIIALNGLEYESLGFPAAFLESGARGVCATLWPVTKSSTMAIYEQMFDSYSKGEQLDMAQAFRRALIDHRNGNIGDSGRTSDEAYIDTLCGVKFLTGLRAVDVVGASEYEIDVDEILEDPSNPIHWAGFSIYGNA